MKLVPVRDVFDVRYGSSLELNALNEQEGGIPFVSRTDQNNGVSAHVELVPDIELIPGGVLSVALGGSPLATFLQTEPFYSGFHVAYLVPRTPITQDVMLYYAACIRANRYRFSYGRQANRSLPGLLVPSLADVPLFAANRPASPIDALVAKGLKAPLLGAIDKTEWKLFAYSDLFEIKKGKRLTQEDMLPGLTAYVGATDSNNGVTARIAQEPLHAAGLITVTYDGSIGEAFYQPEPFWASDAVNVFYPRFPMTREVALFITALIRCEKYRYNYGRKWKLDVMKRSTVLLPALSNGGPDYSVMAQMVRASPAWALLEFAEPTPLQEHTAGARAQPLDRGAGGTVSILSNAPASEGSSYGVE